MGGTERSSGGRRRGGAKNRTAQRPGDEPSRHKVLRAVDVHRIYERGDVHQTAVNGVTIEIDAGAFTSVMGPSGSGKSTLLHLLGLLDTPTSGMVEFEGRQASSLTDDERSEIRRRRMGFVFQAFNLIPVLSVADNVALPLVLDRRPGREIDRSVERMLDLVGIGRQAHKRPTELSGGEQQRVAIARALVGSPAVLLADEPTGNLDSTTGSEIVALLRSVQEELNQSVVVVTHDPGVAARGDKVHVLRDGRLESTIDVFAEAESSEAKLDQLVRASLARDVAVAP